MRCESYNHYGLMVLKIEDKIFAFAKNLSEAKQACASCIEEFYYCFKPEFIVQNITIQLNNAEEVIAEMQAALSNDCNEIIKAIVDKEKFVEMAISWDGIGHFIASYDGEELSLMDLEHFEEIEEFIKEELEIDNSIDWLFYRID